MGRADHTFALQCSRMTRKQQMFFDEGKWFITSVTRYDIRGLGYSEVDFLVALPK